MCKTKTCSLKTACYRFMAKPDPHYQSYANFNRTKDKCFITYEKPKKVRK